ncbi:MAG TPA: RluA family pseudouridine synthase [Pyrinomonadaceae bacterium]|nr:RluA family pseudouridine synthase [Pyrinomonadaceae bacterium]
MSEPIRFTVEATIKKKRLDRFLFERVTTVSKMYLRNLIDRGECSVNGEIEPAGYHLKKDDFIEIKLDAVAVTAMKPERLPVKIIFEDKDIIVVDKPAEMLVHPTLGQKSGTLLNALAYYLNREILDSAFKTEKQNQTTFTRPGLIHRLDKQTSGLMVVAKTPRSLSFLSNHFQRKLVKKRYFAVLQGIVRDESGTINEPIGRNDEEKNWSVKADGKSAETNFKVLERFVDKTLLELEPVTGRTNQLRIHCAYIGHPIIGDDKYGGLEFSRLCLHAAKLSFYHPTTNIWIEFESKMPVEFIQLAES